MPRRVSCALFGGALAAAGLNAPAAAQELQPGYAAVVVSGYNCTAYTGDTCDSFVSAYETLLELDAVFIDQSPVVALGVLYAAEFSPTRLLVTATLAMPGDPSVFDEFNELAADGSFTLTQDATVEITVDLPLAPLTGVVAGPFSINERGTERFDLAAGDEISFNIESVPEVGDSFEIRILGVEPCGPADIAQPFDDLSFADISAFIDAFQNNEPIADLAAPTGNFTFADITAFLDAFDAGCP